jgi:hypothetical protein
LNDSFATLLGINFSINLTVWLSNLLHPAFKIRRLHKPIVMALPSCFSLHFEVKHLKELWDSL